jgi:hypothetical protein
VLAHGRIARVGQRAGRAAAEPVHAELVAAEGTLAADAALEGAVAVADELPDELVVLHRIRSSNEELVGNENLCSIYT